MDEPKCAWRGMEFFLSLPPVLKEAGRDYVLSCCSALGACGCVNLVPWNSSSANLLLSPWLCFVCVRVCVFTRGSRFVNNLIFMTCSGAFLLRIYRVIIFSWVTVYLQFFSFCCPPPSTQLKVSYMFLFVFVFY